MPHRRHPQTGCRPDVLFGVWAVEPTAHQRVVDLCLSIPLADLRASRELKAEGDKESGGRPGYERQGPVGVISVGGTIVKHPTSFSDSIEETSTVETQKALAQAVADPAIDRILLKIDSHGGQWNGTPELYRAIRKADSLKPVYAHSDGAALSAANYIGSAARRFTANPDAMIGSIGAYTVLKDYSGKWEKDGIKVHVFSSGEHKGAGAENTPLTEPQKQQMQAMVNEVADLFVRDVAAGRKMPVEKVKSLADGRVWIAAKAKENGLIDDVKGLDDVLAELSAMSPAALQHRSFAMSLSAEQIQRIRASVPGAATAPDEKIESVAADFAVSAAGQLAEKDRIIAGKMQEVAALSARLPKQVDPDVLAGQAENVADKIELKVEAGKISAAQAAILRSAVIPAEGKVNAAMLAKMEDGQRPVDVLLKVIDAGTPTGVAAGEKATTHELKRPTYGGISADGKESQADTAALIKQYDEEMKQWIESRLPPQTAAAR